MFQNNSIFTELGDSRSFNDVFAYNISISGGALTNHAGVRETIAYNNVFYSPAGGGVACSPCSTTALTMKNNIISAPGTISTGGALFNEAHNIYWSNGSPFSDMRLNSTSKVVNPKFVSPGTGNFKLQSGSPAINAGVPNSVSAGFKADFTQEPVPQLGAVDIGAFEMP